ncbi:MAG: hypothetical protein AAB403_08555 [Planctomycetota bacterium]
MAVIARFIRRNWHRAGGEQRKLGRTEDGIPVPGVILNDWRPQAAAVVAGESFGVRYPVRAVFTLAPVDYAFSPVRFRWGALYYPVRMARIAKQGHA